MQKLFLENIGGKTATVCGEQARHIAKSLRMRVGDMLMVTDGAGYDYGCRISEITADSVTLEICYKQANGSEPTCKLTIFQGVPKGAKMEDIIQKCVELGVTKIVPVLTKRSISRPDEKSAQKKCARYNKISFEAAQQSGRGTVPEIAPQTTLEQAAKTDSAQKKILFYEGGGDPLDSIIAPDDSEVSVYIGPEGGFEDAEVELLESLGAHRATLGPRILRTQTAPVAAAAAIMLLTGNMK